MSLKYKTGELIMNVKKVVVSGAVVLAMFCSGIGGAAAYVSWQGGHDNIQKTSANIDILVSRINDLKGKQGQAQQALADAQNQLKALQQQYNDLANQKNTEEQALQQQIQQKIAEGQKAVAAKQSEVDSLNGKVSDLNTQIADKLKSEDELTKALRDAQDVKNKSDQVVDQTK